RARAKSFASARPAIIGGSRFCRFKYAERGLVVALGDTETIVASRAGSLVKGVMKWPDQNVQSALADCLSSFMFSLS
ncbi:MAG: hypothetical protein ACKVIN_01650, partial [Longimicrobiales bacterium]